MLTQRLLLVLATLLQAAAVAYCVVLLRTHRTAMAAWLCLLGCLVSMLSWRLVVTTGITPGPTFNTVIAIWGSAGALLAMFFFGREVARRQDAEADRDRLLESERVARSEAERSNRVKDQFMAVLSHELRTPLSAILGWCAIVRESGDSRDAERAIETIERNACLQARLVDDLLEVTRMQTGSLDLEMVPVALDELVATAVEAIRPSAEAKGVTIALAPPPSTSFVMGDAGRLQQVVSNLLVNAVKFSASTGTVRVSVTPTATDAQLQVSDDGIGIAPEFMPRLFEPFWQADSTQTRRHGGLGLGLAIASTIVQLHHGRIHAESAGPGAGATFIVRLPLVSDTTDAVRDMARAPQDVPDGGPALAHVHALVVDDERDVREMVARLLEQSGASVVALGSGAALDAAMARSCPDVLVLDIGMPDEDGYSLIRRIRRWPPGQGGDIPAISLTAHAREEDRQRAIAAGFQAHLTKPLDVPLFLSTVRALVPVRRLENRGAAAPAGRTAPAPRDAEAPGRSA